MATSGSMVTGSSSGRSIRFDWWVNRQDISGNYTEIGWNLVGDGTYTGTNNQGWVACGPFDLWIAGTQFYKGDRLHVKKGDVVNSGTHILYHDNSGNCTFAAALSCAVSSSSINVSSEEHSWSLPTIPRYATITTHQVNSVSQDSISIKWNADVSCSEVQYSLNGGGWTAVSGYPVYTISGLESGTNYTVKTRVKRTDSGLWSESGTLTATTTDYVVRLNIDGTWKNGVPYIKVDGTWKKAIPYIKANSVWKKGV